LIGLLEEMAGAFLDILGWGLELPSLQESFFVGTFGRREGAIAESRFGAGVIDMRERWSSSCLGFDLVKAL